MMSIDKIRTDKFTLNELGELQMRVQNAIKIKKEQERQKLVQEVKATVEDAGFSLMEIFGQPRKAQVSVIKYKNPADPDQTWTGRGRKPAWLVDAIEDGKELEDFSV